jgi:signal peptidase I
MAENTATVETAPGDRQSKTKQEPARNSIAEWAVTILLLLFGTTTLVQAFVIPTGSMEDTLLIGDHLLVDKLAYAPAGDMSKYLLPYEEPKHGDIIVFRYPGDISQTFVKRVIGLPGDHLKMIHRQVFRNGVALNEPYTVINFLMMKAGIISPAPPRRLPKACKLNYSTRCWITTFKTAKS